MKTQTPSTTESTDLAERAIQRRAIEAVIWGMPAVNYHLMYQEMVNKVKGGFNQVLYWSRLLDVDAKPRRYLPHAFFQY